MEIKENEQGVIFISTTQGLCFLNEKRNKNGKTDFSFTVIDNNLLTCRSFPADNGVVWITPGDNKLYNLTGNKENGFTRKEISFKNLPYGIIPAGFQPLIQSIAHDTVNHILYFIRYNAVIKYDEKTAEYENIAGAKFAAGYLTQPALYSNGNIWMPDNSKLLVFNIQNKTTEWIKSDDPKIDLMVNSVYCVYEDRSGNIWIGTSGYGLLKYNVRAEKFHHTDNSSISWMSKGNNGHILIVKRSDVAWVFDTKTRRYIKQLPDSASVLKRKFYGGGIEALLQDKDGSYWMAKQNFLHYDDSLKKFEYPVFNKVFSFPLALISPGIRRKIPRGLKGEQRSPWQRWTMRRRRSFISLRRLKGSMP